MISASNFKSFSRSLDQFFLTVGQNNFGNKIPVFKLSLRYLKILNNFDFADMFKSEIVNIRAEKKSLMEIRISYVEYFVKFALAGNILFRKAIKKEFLYE